MKTRIIIGYETYYDEERNALITPLGKITLVHLDQPNDATIESRIREVLSEEIDGTAFEDDCPLCREMSKQPYDVVYCDQSEFEDNEDPTQN